MKRLSTAIKELEKAFPGISNINEGELYGYGKDTIFLGNVAEGGTIDGNSACNYYSFESDPKEKIWIMGIHEQLVVKLSELGFFAECHNPGVYVAYRI